MTVVGALSRRARDDEVTRAAEGRGADPRRATGCSWAAAAARASTAVRAAGLACTTGVADTCRPGARRVGPIGCLALCVASAGAEPGTEVAFEPIGAPRAVVTAGLTGAGGRVGRDRGARGAGVAGIVGLSAAQTAGGVEGPVRPELHHTGGSGWARVRSAPRSRWQRQTSTPLEVDVAAKASLAVSVVGAAASK